MIKAKNGEVTFRGTKKQYYSRSGYYFTCAQRGTLRGRVQNSD